MRTTASARNAEWVRLAERNGTLARVILYLGTTGTDAATVDAIAVLAALRMPFSRVTLEG